MVDLAVFGLVSAQLIAEDKLNQAEDITEMTETAGIAGASKQSHKEIIDEEAKKHPESFDEDDLMEDAIEDNFDGDPEE